MSSFSGEEGRQDAGLCLKAQVCIVGIVHIMFTCIFVTDDKLRGINKLYFFLSLTEIKKI